MINQTYTFTSVATEPIITGDGNLTVNISRVVIPRIQRPYAQGRIFDRETRIRNQFIDAIFDHLMNDKVMDLHFIYGAVTKYQDNGNTSYQLELLDGQQRFTTLFLLHWFLMNRENGHQDNPKITNALKSFIYETRTTSTEFCKSLAQNVCDLSDGTMPSLAIRKARWYYHRFDKDSSIRGMLVMLDTINAKYNSLDASNLLKRVDNLQFYVLPLVDYNMAEELYIKMNERGLPLSPFDNFKAEFTGAMRNATNLDETVELDDGSLATHKERISIYLDTKWIDIFWKPGSSLYDSSYMHFFSRFFAYRYIIDSYKTANEIQDDKSLPINLFFTRSEDKRNLNEYLGFEKYAHELAGHPDYFEHIERILNVLHDRDNMQAIHDALKPVWENAPQRNFFVEPDVSFSQTLLVVFGAICEYIIAFPDFDKEIFAQWMRVVWNVVENTNIDSLRAATGPIRNLCQMISQTAESTPTTVVDFYLALSKVQIANQPGAVSEEIEKARRIAQDQSWLAEFVNAESHPYLKGAVGFFYHPEITLEDFIHYRNLVKEMFDEKGISPVYREDHLLIRAIVSNLKTWNINSLKDRYITENADTNKRLKQLLLGNDDVRKMFIESLDDAGSTEYVKLNLEEFIRFNSLPYWDDAEHYWDNRLVIAHNTLSDDIKLYDWMATQTSPVCVTEYKGHYAVSRRNVWFNRFLIDCERNQMAEVLTEEPLCMDYVGDGTDHGTQEDFDEYGRYKGENVMLMRPLDNGFSFFVSFERDHCLRVFVLCPNSQACHDFFEKYSAPAGYASFIDDEENIVYLDVDVEQEYKREDFRYLLVDKFIDDILPDINNLYDESVKAVSKI